MSPDLTDAQVDRICDGLVQNAAKVRFLESMGLTVRRKPNGRPLVNAAHYDAVCNASAAPRRVSSGPQPKWRTA